MRRITLYKILLTVTVLFLWVPLASGSSLSLIVDSYLTQGDYLNISPDFTNYSVSGSARYPIEEPTPLSASSPVSYNGGSFLNEMTASTYFNDTYGLEMTHGKLVAAGPGSQNDNSGFINQKSVIETSYSGMYENISDTEPLNVINLNITSYLFFQSTLDQTGENPFTDVQQSIALKVYSNGELVDSHAFSPINNFIPDGWNVSNYVDWTASVPVSVTWSNPFPNYYIVTGQFNGTFSLEIEQSGTTAVNGGTVPLPGGLLLLGAGLSRLVLMRRRQMKKA